MKNKIPPKFKRDKDKISSKNKNKNKMLSKFKKNKIKCYLRGIRLEIKLLLISALKNLNHAPILREDCYQKYN